MALVALICMYDHRALGLRSISNALQAAGHEAVVIHFKLPITELHEEYKKNPSHYEALHTSDLGERFGIRRYNFDVKPWTPLELSMLKELLLTIQPELIGISTRSVYEKHLAELMQYISPVPDAVTVAGGFGATFGPQNYIGFVDFVCLGEGVLPMLRMADAIDRKQPLEDIGSLVYQRNGRTIQNPLIPPDEEDTLYSFVTTSVTHYVIEENQVWPTDIFLQNIPIPHSDAASYHTMAGLGCLNNCTYCCAGQMVNLYERSTLPKRRLRPIEHVIDELKFALGYGFHYITFLDSFFVAPHQYLLDFFAAYKQEVGLKFFAQFLPQQLIDKPDILGAAVDAGLDYTVIGIQSGSDRVNREIFNRPMPNSQVVELASLINRYEGINVQYHIITHNPFVDEAAFRETLDLIKVLPKDNAELVLLRLRPFPGTKIADMVASLPNPSEDDTQEFHKEALFYLLRYYLPDTQFKAVMSRLENADFETLKRFCKDTIPTRTQTATHGMFKGVMLREFDIHLYEARRAQFGQDYATALDEWLQEPSAQKERVVDRIFEESVWLLGAHEVMLAKVDLSGSFYGLGWGQVESNVHGQHWRWIGPNGKSSLFVLLKPGGGYQVETLIHTAIGEALYGISAEVNGVTAEDQEIVREGASFFHRCTIPESLIKKANGNVKLSFKVNRNEPRRLSKDMFPNEKTRLVALSGVEFRPLFTNCPDSNFM